ncbi:hypothetical protein GGF32_009593 [Allomyces javanicus]|nr:hypothetical protein GGF32_009593 [Allomyces javanicus]
MRPSFATLPTDVKRRIIAHVLASNSDKDLVGGFVRVHSRTAHTLVALRRVCRDWHASVNGVFLGWHIDFQLGLASDKTPTRNELRLHVPVQLRWEVFVDSHISKWKKPPRTAPVLAVLEILKGPDDAEDLQFLADPTGGEHAVLTHVVPVPCFQQRGQWLQVPVDHVKSLGLLEGPSLRKHTLKNRLPLNRTRGLPAIFDRLVAWLPNVERLHPAMRVTGLAVKAALVALRDTLTTLDLIVTPDWSPMVKDLDFELPQLLTLRIRIDTASPRSHRMLTNLPRAPHLQSLVLSAGTMRPKAVMQYANTLRTLKMYNGMNPVVKWIDGPAPTLSRVTYLAASPMTFATFPSHALSALERAECDPREATLRSLPAACSQTLRAVRANKIHVRLVEKLARMPRLTVLNVKGVGFGGDDHRKIDYRNSRFHDGYDDGYDDDFGDGSESDDGSLDGYGDDAHGGASDGGHEEEDYGDHDDGRAWRLAYVQGNAIWRAIPSTRAKTSVAEKLVIEVDKVEDVEEMVLDIMDMASWWVDGELSRYGGLRWKMTTMGHGFPLDVHVASDTPANVIAQLKDMFEELKAADRIEGRIVFPGDVEEEADDHGQLGSDLLALQQLLLEAVVLEDFDQFML